MVKAISSLNREYIDALRKYCRPKKAAMLNGITDCLILAGVIFALFYMCAVEKKVDILATLFVVAAVWAKANNVYKSRKEWNDFSRVIYDVIVDNNKFITDSKRDVKDSTVKNTLHYEIDCDKLISAKEGGNFFFIETEPNSYIIIGYNDISEGSPEQLRQILKNSLKDKYKIFDK